MKQKLLWLIAFIFIACHSNKTEENKEGYAFNKNEKSYVVTDKKLFTDSTGKEIEDVIMTGPNHETYESYVEPGDTMFKIGDTVIIGHNDTGDYIVHVNKQSE